VGLRNCFANEASGKKTPPKVISYLSHVPKKARQEDSKKKPGWRKNASKPGENTLSLILSWQEKVFSKIPQIGASPQTTSEIPFC
jgi:hypothetical protein